MKLVDNIVFVLLFGLLLFVSLNRHSRHPRFNYHSQIYSDKAGYQVYLPATFYYEWDAAQMPVEIDSLVGSGFSCKDNKIRTKYPIGVAVMQLPFFTLAAAIDYVQGEHVYLGFTENQHLALNWSTTVYGTLALLLIFLIAVQQWNLTRAQAYLLVFLLFGCSNLLYYLTRDAGMAHAYLLFCYSLIIYLYYRFLASKSWMVLAGVVAISLLALSIRHINGLFFAVVGIYFLLTYRYRLNEVTRNTWAKGVGIGSIIGCPPVILQLLYNQYAFGSSGATGYANESFSNWDNIKLLELWFAPNNGALLYAPIMLIALYGIVKYRKQNRHLLWFLVLFLLISVVYGAWWSPTLGCGFGHRGFIEFFVFFSLPMSRVIRHWTEKKQRVAWAIGLVVATILFSAQWSFDGCWYGEGPWDWAELAGLITS
jgi:hypothetical protein